MLSAGVAFRQQFCPILSRLAGIWDAGRAIAAAPTTPPNQSVGGPGGRSWAVLPSPRKAAASDAAAFETRSRGVRDVLDYLSSSSSEDDGLDEPPECPQDGAGLAGAGLGEAQLGAGAGAGSGAGAAAGGAGLGAAGLGAAGRGAAALGAAGAAAGAACFFAERFLALAFLADFFGAAALDFLAAFFADFLAFLADFFAAFFEDFFADFFFAVTRLFLAFLAFLPFLLFLPLAIVILLLPRVHVYRALQVVRFPRGGQ